MIDIAGEIPTENVISVPIDKTIFVEQGAEDLRQARKLNRCDGLIEFVLHPGDCSARNPTSGEDAITDLLIDKA